MQKCFLTMLLGIAMSFLTQGFSQNVSINTTGNAADASAMLDITATDKGLLVPRMTQAQRTAITTPANALLVYQTDGTRGFYFYSTVSTSWTLLASSGSSISSLNGLTAVTQTFATPGTGGTAPNWSSVSAAHTLNLPLASTASVTAGLLSNADWTSFNSKPSASGVWSSTGNAGTVLGTNFLGTTDLRSLRFRTNNNQGMLLDSAGNVAIGNGPIQSSGAGFIEKLLVDAGSTVANPTTSINVISGKGYINNYLQLNIQNKSNGTIASADVVATNDAGNETNLINFIDMGINSSGNTSTGVIGGANNAYLYSTGNDLAIGNATAGRSLNFFTGGVGNTERMRIDSAGRVAIGTSSTPSDLTLFQSTNATSTRGFRLTGNSIDGTNTGSGVAMALGYNVVNNKQLWMGDPDYFGNSAGTFVRYSASVGQAILDGIAGDNSVRRPIALGVGSDPYSAVVFGYDGSSINPGSYVWSNGNMTIGNAWRSNAAPSNGLLVQGNVGIGTVAPSTRLHVQGANPLTLTGVALGTSTAADSLLTITSGLVRKLPMSTFTSSANTWSTTGNAGTVLGTNFLGTTDLRSIRFRTNNTQGMLLDSAGNVAIGDEPLQTAGANMEKLLVDAGSTAANPSTTINVITGKGFINSYLQLNIQNKSAGTLASSDVVATADNGSETTNYIDMGINSSGNTANYFGGANDAYLYNVGQNLLIGTGTASKSVVFMTGGGVQSTNERMRIDPTGDVGIGTNAPGEKLDVIGNAKISGSLYVDDAQTNTGTKIPGVFFGGPASGEVIASKRSAGTNQYGLDFYTGSNLRMNINSAGYVGIGTTTSTSSLDVNGSLSHSITVTSGSITLNETHYSVILTSGSPSVTLPSASSCSGRVYLLINNTGGSRTCSTYVPYGGGTTTSLPSALGITVQSDGSSWYRVQ